MFFTKVKSFRKINQNKQFWLGQVFMILATVIGVYLAANVGFKEAINYENLIGEKNKYYMTLSLSNEIKDSIEESNLIAHNKSKQIGTNTIDLPSYYVWESMKQNPDTLELPSDIITGTRRYIHNTIKMFNQFNHKQLGGYVLKKEINKLNDKVKKELLPKIEKYNSELKEFLEAKGML